MCNGLGRKCLHREGPELSLRPRTVCLIKGLNRLYSRAMVIDPEKGSYVMFSFLKKHFTWTNIYFVSTVLLCSVAETKVSWSSNSS